MGVLLAPKRGRELRAELWSRIRPDQKSSSAQDGGQNGSSRATAGNSRTSILNAATREQLLDVYGIGPVLANRIIENRPYSYDRDVVERGIISESTFAQIEKDLLRKEG